jgi:hypothetical protein
VLPLALAAIGATGNARSQAKPAFDFSDPRRSYLRLDGELDVFYERGLASDPQLFTASTTKLTALTKELIAALPAPARPQLKATAYYLLWGSQSPFGGQDSGTRYVGGGTRNPLNDPRWPEGSIVILNARNFERQGALWSRKLLLVLMARAWHLSQWPARHPAIVEPYDNALKLGLYRNVVDYKGRTQAKASALNHPVDYFAELSAAYFAGIDYFPFERFGLKDYDPAGYRMVEALWRTG